MGGKPRKPRHEERREARAAIERARGVLVETVKALTKIPLETPVGELFEIAMAAEVATDKAGDLLAEAMDACD